MSKIALIQRNAGVRSSPAWHQRSSPSRPIADSFNAGAAASTMLDDNWRKAVAAV
jgi:hypothetical protein